MDLRALRIAGAVVLHRWAKRRQAVVGVITAISVAGVAVGVASLIIALAITNGMRRDLQERLLSSTAHVELMRVQDDGIRDWTPQDHDRAEEKARQASGQRPDKDKGATEARTLVELTWRDGVRWTIRMWERSCCTATDPRKKERRSAWSRWRRRRAGCGRWCGRRCRLRICESVAERQHDDNQ